LPKPTDLLIFVELEEGFSPSSINSLISPTFGVLSFPLFSFYFSSVDVADEVEAECEMHQNMKYFFPDVDGAGEEGLATSVGSVEVQQRAVAQQCKHAQANPFESLLRFTLLRVTIGKLRHQRRRGKLKYSSSHETLVRNSHALR